MWILKFPDDTKLCGAVTNETDAKNFTVRLEPANKVDRSLANEIQH